MSVEIKIVKYSNFNNKKDHTIKEIASHFDITPQKYQGSAAVSLHTEYSFGGRAFNKGLFSNQNDYETIRNSTTTIKDKNGNDINIPLLWDSEEWSKEFAKFVINFSNKMGVIPKIVEIHPPFKDKVSWEDFIVRYKIFEGILVTEFKDVEILIENRHGSLYRTQNADRRDSPFLLSRIEDYIKLSELIRLEDLKLKMILDLPQFIQSHRNTHREKLSIVFPKLMRSIKLINHHIGAVHLWGYGLDKKNNKKNSAHYGGLDKLIYDQELSENSQDWLLFHLHSALFNPQVNTPIYLVPEINSGCDDTYNTMISQLNKHFDIIT